MPLSYTNHKRSIMHPIHLYHYPAKANSWNNHPTKKLTPPLTILPKQNTKEKALLGQQIIDAFQSNLPEGYLLMKVRSDGKFVHSGKATFLGYPIQEWIQRNPYISAWLANEKRTKEKAQRLWLDYIENTQKPIRIWFHYPGSTLAPIPIEVHRQFWGEGKDEQESILLLIRDLRDEYCLRAKKRDDANFAKHKIQQQRADFAAQLHDWKVPLTTIESSTWLCLSYNKDGQEDKRSKHLKRIQSAVADLKMDFQNWQLWNEPQSIKEYETVNIRDFIEQRIEVLSNCLKTGQELVYWHQGVETLRTDPYALRHILDNLISNAIKYSPEETKICIHVWADEKQVRFQIMDHGIGIPKDDIPHLLEPRFRAGNSHGVPGNGLGLSNVNRLLKIVGGVLEVQSTLNQGSTFIVTIKNQN